jgi:uncharacterized protein (TIGR03382 family)
MRRSDSGGCSAGSGGGLWFGIAAFAFVAMLVRRKQTLSTIGGSVLVVLLPLFDSRNAFAQYAPVDFTQQTFAAMNLASSYQLSMAALGSRRGQNAPVPTITRGDAAVPKKLAASYPPSHRATAERALAALLEAYPAVEDKLGVPRGDVGAAVAFFIVACYEAYRDETIDPAVYKSVIDQIRPVLAESSRFAKASAKDRRTLYEQMAILGMLVTMTRLDLEKHPDRTKSEALRQASRDYLLAFAVDPEALQLGASGFVRD